MTAPDFENPDVQRASWRVLRDTLFKGVSGAIEAAKALYPTEDLAVAAVRDGMILTQLHMILAYALGEVEGRIARQTMVPDEDVKARREAFLADGRVGTTVKT